jgi:subtilase family serine protease
VIDGEPRLIQNIGPLESGESREVYFSYKYACESGTPHMWSVAADVKNTIDESDEDNNSRQGKFTCSK